MIRSFRLRLALLSAMLTGVVLAAFGLGSWWLIRNIKMDRLDSDVRAAALRLVSRSPTDTPWQEVEERLANDIGVRNLQDLLVLVQVDDAAPAYRSAHWPAGLDASSFVWSALPLAVRGNAPDFSLLPSAFAQEPPPRPPHRRPGAEGFASGHPPPHRPGERPFPPPRDPPRDPPPVPPMSVAPALIAPPALTALPAQEAPSPAPEPASSAVRADLHRPPPAPRVALVTRATDGFVWHIGLASTDVARVAVGVNLRVIDADMKGIRNAFLVALPFALVLIGLGSWLFAARALRPVHKLVATTRKVTVEGLGQRIDLTGEDREFAELIEVFNRMLGRLERSFQQAHRFTADAAHELKTPLAIVQGQLERAINQSEGRAMQAALSSILDEVRRLSVISRKLLLLSQADAAQLRLQPTTIDLSAALLALAEDTRMLAPDVKVSEEIPPGISLSADENLLTQILHNLISNAIKYNIEGGWIRIAASRVPERVIVVVSNASAGIEAAQRAHLFERFYRADSAHGRRVDGVGLGLSLSRELARVHGGDLELDVREDRSVEVRLTLPALPRLV